MRASAMANDKKYSFHVSDIDCKAGVRFVPGLNGGAFSLHFSNLYIEYKITITALLDHTVDAMIRSDSINTYRVTVSVFIRGYLLDSSKRLV